ncbi:hypothetical protein [Yoonia maritima]|uniref:hypothetical protein n=1 Tax=Yoonia maritima TaxID=1435347 RepID=UPI0013A6756C|nr:hypothetical protein [Yoonia maritima]
MGHDWIIDVLADLKRFANTHDLPMLEAQLENTTLVASAEIGRMVENTCHLTQGDSPGNRRFSPSTGAGRRA